VSPFSVAHQAEFRFYAELNDFLPHAVRHTTLVYAFDNAPAVKDAIEALGVPHTEVDLVLVNGLSVPFSHPLHDADRVAVYPVFEAIDIGTLVRVRPRPLREPKFLLDVHLGRLAAYLRMLGFDTSYGAAREDGELAATSRREARILLTRDNGLLKRNLVTHGYFVREQQPRRQVVEVIRRFDLARAIVPFTRCQRCNGRLAPAARAEVTDRLPPRTAQLYDAFWTCTSCGHVYWRGSHFTRMRGFVDEVVAAALRPNGAETGGDG
jgi:uncharacterized protein with PIN domain